MVFIKTFQMLEFVVFEKSDFYTEYTETPKWHLKRVKGQLFIYKLVVRYSIKTNFSQTTSFPIFPPTTIKIIYIQYSCT